MRARVLSYSQEYEEVIIYHVLKDIENGFYIDVGVLEYEYSVRDYINNNSYYKVGRIVTYPLRPLRPIARRILRI